MEGLSTKERWFLRCRPGVYQWKSRPETLAGMRPWATRSLWGEERGGTPLSRQARKAEIVIDGRARLDGARGSLLAERLERLKGASYQCLLRDYVQS